MPADPTTTTAASTFAVIHATNAPKDVLKERK